MSFKLTHQAPNEVNTTEYTTTLQVTADKVFEVDGISCRNLMPCPHNPSSKPVLWEKYDGVTVRERLDQLDLREFDRAIFESTVSSFGSGTPKDVSFFETPR